MKLHLLSDLHLNVSRLEIPRTDADIVILAGDIARPKEAVAWASGFAQPVLYVIGNHEFYGGHIDGTVQDLRRLSAGTGIRVLDCDQIAMNGVRFLGMTLWTDFMLFGAGDPREQAIEQARAFTRDFSRIRLDEAPGALFSPAAATALFNRHRSWLLARLDEPFPGPTVVITHHAPSPRSIHSRFADSLLNACFISDMEPLMDGHRIALWLHGHTHDSFDYAVNGTRVVCNPRGYAKNGVNENVAFNPELTLEIG